MINPDGTMNLNTITKFGRSFSIIRIPYAFKLLIQELMAMNIQMRIITEDNIDQLLSMTFSDNIGKLLNTKAETNADLKNALSEYNNIVYGLLSRERTEKQVKENINNETPEIPEPFSVESTPVAELEYPDVSPAYSPESFGEAPIQTSSPTYAPSLSIPQVEQVAEPTTSSSILEVQEPKETENAEKVPDSSEKSESKQVNFESAPPTSSDSSSSGIKKITL
jgi:DNA-directed RNA polymerase II subunit RPB2